MALFREQAAVVALVDVLEQAGELHVVIFLQRGVRAAVADGATALDDVFEQAAVALDDARQARAGEQAAILGEQHEQQTQQIDDGLLVDEPQHGSARLRFLVVRFPVNAIAAVEHRHQQRIFIRDSAPDARRDVLERHECLLFQRDRHGRLEFGGFLLVACELPGKRFLAKEQREDLQQRRALRWVGTRDDRLEVELDEVRLVRGDAVREVARVDSPAVSVRQHGMLDMMRDAAMLEQEVRRSQVVQRLIDFVLVVFRLDIILVFDAAVTLRLDDSRRVRKATVERRFVRSLVRTEVDEVALDRHLRDELVAERLENRPDQRVLDLPFVAFLRCRKNLRERSLRRINERKEAVAVKFLERFLLRQHFLDVMRRNQRILLMCEEGANVLGVRHHKIPPANTPHPSTGFTICFRYLRQEFVYPMENLLFQLGCLYKIHSDISLIKALMNLSLFYQKILILRVVSFRLQPIAKPTFIRLFATW